MADQTKEETDQSNLPMKCEVKVWHDRYNRDGQQEKVSVESLTSHAEPISDEYALVVNRKFNEKNHLESTTLTVNSPQILKVLQEVVKRHPSIATDFTEPFDVSSPFQMLHHHWDDLEKFRTKLEDDDEIRMHMDLLFDFMQTELGPSKKVYERQARAGQCEFANLWVIFKPGQLAVTFHKSYPWLMKVVKTAYEEDDREGDYVEVYCVYTEHDGTRIGEAKKVFQIYQKKEFAQEDPAIVKDLTVFPLSFYEDDRNLLESQLRERGKEFVQLSETALVRDYDGPAEHIKDPPPNYWSPEETDEWLVWLSYTETGRIILDRVTYEEENHQTALLAKHRASSLDLALCPPFVFGYSCNRKEWCRFFLPFVSEVKWRPDPFASLALPDDKKTLVRALVSSHKFPSNSRDRAEQKGKGLVCLLHGPAGSGKTLTAECAAELAHRALFSCSMSELNKQGSAYFEDSFADILRLAATWNAVVLLDEADVFLEARRDDSPDAVERNALVAVFLRHIEYFGGIVFLTTNRIHVFDSAMKSRIHMALGYTVPNEELRRAIWASNVRKLPQEQVDEDLDDDLGDLAAEELNGREIANAVTTAATLARFGDEKLQYKHFESVLNVRRNFDENLRDMKSEIASSSSGPKQSQSEGFVLLKRGSVLDHV